MYAAQVGSVDMLKMLIDKGAEYFRVDRLRKTAERYALENAKWDALDVLEAERKKREGGLFVPLKRAF